MLTNNGPRIYVKSLLLVMTMACLFSHQVCAEDDAKAAEIQVESAILKTVETTVLSAEVAGIISVLDVKEGLVVEPGRELGRIRDEAVKLDLERAKTAIELAKKKQQSDIDQRLATKSQAVADNEYQRASAANLRVPDTYPPNEIDRLRLVADRAKLEVERAKYQRDLATMDVTLAEHEYRKFYELYLRHKIKAPSAGVVVSIDKHLGEWVEPGTPLLTIVRTDLLRVEGFVTAEQAARIQVGDEAEVSLDALRANAKVVFISPDTNPVNSQVRVFLEFENTKVEFRPGLRVKAKLLSKNG